MDSNDCGPPSIGELEFVIHHGLQARKSGLPTDTWIEPDSHRLQFVHDWWSEKGCISLSALMALPSPPSPQSHPDEGRPSQVATTSTSNVAKPTLASKAPNPVPNDYGAIRVLGSGGDDSEALPTRGVNYLEKVLDQVHHRSTSHDSTKSTAASYGKANTYSQMSSAHHNNLLSFLNTYAESVMGYCQKENLNPLDAFQYLQGKLPVKNLSPWQAFCQLRGLLRAFGMSHNTFLSHIPLSNFETGANPCSDDQDDDEEPTAITPSSQGPINMRSFDYNRADPAFIKDTTLGLHDMSDNNAYSLLLGHAEATGKDKQWKADLIVAAKNDVDNLNKDAISNNRLTRAQDRAHRNAMTWVSSVSFHKLLDFNPRLLVGHK